MSDKNVLDLADAYIELQPSTNQRSQIRSDQILSAGLPSAPPFTVQSVRQQPANTGSSLSSVNPSTTTNPAANRSETTLTGQAVVTASTAQSLDRTRSIGVEATSPLSSSSSSPGTQASSTKKHSSLLRPFLKKKTKRTVSSGTPTSTTSGGDIAELAGVQGVKKVELETVGCGSHSVETGALGGHTETMKRNASPIIPEGATQPKLETHSRNGKSHHECNTRPTAYESVEKRMDGSVGSDVALQNAYLSGAHGSVSTSGAQNDHGSSALSGSNNGPKLNPKLQNAYRERVAIIDFGAQYGKVIDRRIREQNVMSEILPFNTKAADLVAKNLYKAIVLSGGPNSVYEENAPQFDPALLTCGLPVLGICYGFQIINKVFGGSVTKEPIREDGQLEIDVDTSSLLFSGLSTKQKVLLTHGDSVVEATAAKSLKVIGKSCGFVTAIGDDHRSIYGVQFHPEVDLSVNGREILRNFLFRIAKFSGDFTIENREQKCIEEIRRVVGDKKVLVMVSGGVDSTVCATLLRKALGSERVVAVHIDNGFMRTNESDNVLEMLNNLNLDVKRCNAYHAFMNGRIKIDGQESPPLMRTVHPEIKRKIIGDTFMRVKDRFLEEMKLTDIFLAQGTLRPDLIESASCIASAHADVIKTHHNDTALVRELRELGKVVEPLKDFHKDEVRELGLSLGLPPITIHRHPFPGPGLAIRILCAERSVMHDLDLFLTTQHQLNVITNFVNNVDNALQPRDIAAIAPNFSDVDLQLLRNRQHIINTTLLPIHTVGVQGDRRSYAYAVALSTDEQPIPWDALDLLARMIPRLLHCVNRVVYAFGDVINYPLNDVTHTYLNEYTISLVRWADRIATDALCGIDENGKQDPEFENCYRRIQQMPVVMLPLHFDRDPVDRKMSTLRSFVLRPFITNDFMTGIAALPGRDLPEKTILEMVRRIRERVPLTSRVMLDLTPKPPGTTEWE